MIVLKCLKIRNFKCYDSYEIDLTNAKGLVLIVGRNGAGKSSLIEAIHACITGRGFTKTLNQLLRDGEEDGYLELLFSVGDDEYTITRFFGKYSKTELVKNGQLVSNAATVVKKILDGIFPDGESVKIHFIKDISLKDYLLSIIDIDSYLEKISVLNQKYETDIANIENKIANLNEIVVQKEKEYDQLHQRLQEYRLKLETIENQLASFSSINFEIDYLVDLKSKQDRINASYNEFIQHNMKKISEFNEKIKLLQNQKIQLMQTKNKLSQERNEYLTQLSDLEQKVIDSIYRNTLNKITTAYNERTQDINNKIKQLENTKQKYISSCESEIKELTNKFNLLKNKLDTEKLQLSKTIQENIAEIEKLNNKIDVIKKSSCPECGAQISKEKSDELCKTYISKIDDLNKITDEHKESIKEKDEQLQKEAERLNVSILDLQEKYKAETDKIVQELETLSNAIEQNRSKYENILKLDKLELLKQMNVEYESNVKELQKEINDKLIVLEKSLSDVESNISDIEEEYTTLINTKTKFENEYEANKTSYLENLLQSENITAEELNMDVNSLIKAVNQKNALVSDKEKAETVMNEVANSFETVNRNLQDANEQLVIMQESYEVLLSKYKMIKLLKNTRGVKKFIFNQISLLINENLKHFNTLMQVQLETDDNDNVAIYAVNLNGIKVPVEYLSAGETAVFKLSLYLVLEKMFSKVKFPYLFIDENLDKLDSVNIKNVLDVLSQFKELNIYLITHKSEVLNDDVWDYVIDFGNDESEVTAQ